MKALMSQLLEGKRDLALVLGMIGILVVLFSPMPPVLLDLLLIINLSVALLILLVTFYTDSPLKFSTFPSILLIATLFRLALNVTSTRLILDGAYAGEVIAAAGDYVVGGNYIVGLVVFLILVVVQYVVVTNGAQRVAEVAARFTLDSMPGKQMSIDADINMGLIDEHEARRRRQTIEREANFYGAMDGATKFVKGDAIAGIVIILINIVGGLAIGMVQLGMGWSEAVQRFTLLTVGDGIVTQIPSLVIAVATGIIITRAASDARLGREVVQQVLGSPRTLLVVAVALLGLLVLPGLPKWPVALVLAAVLVAAWYSHRRMADGGSDQDAGEEAAAPASTASGPADAEQELLALMQVDPLEIRLGRSIAQAYLPRVDALRERTEGLRRQFAQDLGLVLPRVRFVEALTLGEERYEVLIHGARCGHGELVPDRVLAINPGGQRARLDGRETRDPAYGLPALWIEESSRQLARGAGYTLVDAETVLMTHLSEILKRHAPDLLTREEVERMVNRVRARQGSLVDELIPGVLSLSEVQRVLQLLLREQVGLRQLDAILECLVDAGRQTRAPEELVERVRERLGAGICQRLADPQGELHVMTLAPELERALLGAVRAGDGRPAVSDAAQLEALLKGVAKHADQMISRNLSPVLLCPAPLRRVVRGLVQRSLPYVAVLSLSEVPTHASVRTVGAVDLAA